MGLLHREKTECEECHARFGSYEELVHHAHDAHGRHIVKCADCGKLFLHEKDRLHHVKEEKERKVDTRRHKF
jgi:Zn-finger protein